MGLTMESNSHISGKPPQEKASASESTHSKGQLPSKLDKRVSKVAETVKANSSYQRSESTDSLSESSSKYSVISDTDLEKLANDTAKFSIGVISPPRSGSLGSGITDRDTTTNSDGSPSVSESDFSRPGTPIESKKRSLGDESKVPEDDRTKRLKSKRFSPTRLRASPIDKGPLIQELGLSSYSPRVQDAIIDCYLNKSESLKLSGCGLSEVPQCISTHLPHVRKLDLSKNQLKSFSLSLSNLTHLNLRDNKIGSVSAILPNVEALNLFNNLVDDFNPTPDQFPKLLELNLGKNPLEGFSASLPMLEQLNLKDCQLKTLSATSSGLPELNYINISNNDDLGEISIDQFPESVEINQGVSIDRFRLVFELGLQQYSTEAQKIIISCFLEKKPLLDLSRCNLTEVPVCISSHLQHITHLNLSGNAIESFQATLPNLEDLNIQGNNLKKIDLRKENLPKLQSVNLSQNRDLVSPSLSYVKPLREMNLDEIQEVQSIVHELELQGCSEEVQQRFINCIKGKSSTLDLNGCDLRTIPLAVAKLPNVSVLNLSSNRINNFEEGSFPNIERVELSLNRLTESPNLERAFPNLTSLNLSLNDIREITEFYPRLENLDLSSNRIKNFQPHAGQFFSLQSLNLQGNHLEKVSLKEDFLPSLKSVNIANNPTLFTVSSQSQVLMETMDLEQIREMEELVYELGIEGLSLTVQQIIVSCYLNRSSTLNLSGCGLKRIPSCVATHLKNVTEIDASNNQIGSLPREPCSHILKLNLANNNPPMPTEMIDRAFPNLVVLNIAGNNISEIKGRFLHLQELVAEGSYTSTIDLTEGKFPKLQSQNVTANRQEDLVSIKGRVPPSELSISELRETQELIKKLGIEPYSLEAQQIIITCYLNKDEVLDLSDCDLGEIPSCIKELKHVHTLNLTSNRIENIPNEVFSNITILNLSYNRLREFEDIARAFPKIKEIDVRSNKITRISGRFPNLEVLHAQNNELSELDLQSEPFPRLKSIDVSDNNIMSLSGSLKLLVELRVKGNSLSTLDFSDKRYPRLKVVDASENRLQYMHGSLQNLEEINIARNEFSTLSFSQQAFPKLERINASMNPLTSMGVDLRNLKSLLIAKTDLRTLPVAGSALGKLQNLDITESFIFPLDPSSLPAIEQLKQDSSEIINRRLIMYLGLKEYPSEVQMRIIRCFSEGNTSLDLRNLGLSAVPDCIAKDLNITDLDLSGNELTSFDFEMLNLTRLNLSDNQLRSFTYDREKLPDLEDLNISNNPGILVDLSDSEIIPEA
jgi:Leucine-rich repeat (LRR) protein